MCCRPHLQGVMIQSCKHFLLMAKRAVSSMKHVSPLEDAVVYGRMANILPLRNTLPKFTTSSRSNRTSTMELILLHPPKAWLLGLYIPLPNLELIAKEVHETSSGHIEEDEDEDCACNSCKNKWNKKWQVQPKSWEKCVWLCTVWLGWEIQFPVSKCEKLHLLDLKLSKAAHKNGNRWHNYCFRCFICNNLVEMGLTL
jgi:hypothetical protein